MMLLMIIIDCNSVENFVFILKNSCRFSPQYADKFFSQNFFLLVVLDIPPLCKTDQNV